MQRADMFLTRFLLILFFPLHLEHAANPNISVVPESGGTQDNHIPPSSPAVVPDVPHSPAIIPSSGIKEYILKEDICKSEILWCLLAIATHRSLRSAEKDSKLFSEMFKDSETVKGIQLGRDKMAYCLIFGIAPFFKENFMKGLLLFEHLVIGFDESLNKISQRQQMDLNVRFLSLATNEDKTRYLNSAFLGRSCSEDLLAAFQEATKPLNLKKTFPGINGQP
ncbi:hypothetical protein AVEN_114993-1 [Araneus ventricosus]|uniref:Uncharacterized protein n=1 Tax=Araneus ventricosus TaxID=182803 RepID=A0A4Y1ZXF5_ARAVE|nr:hypothetical protein AVEN_114993-1 [Araneus ventricosus]